MVVLAKSAWTAAASAWSCSSDRLTSVTEAGGGGGGSSAYAGTAKTASSVPSAANRKPRPTLGSIRPSTIKPPSLASRARVGDLPPARAQRKRLTVPAIPRSARPRPGPDPDRRPATDGDDQA